MIVFGNVFAFLAGVGIVSLGSGRIGSRGLPLGIIFALLLSTPRGQSISVGNPSIGDLNATRPDVDRIRVELPCIA